MSKNLKLALYLCIAGVVLGASLFLTTAAQAAEGPSTPVTGTSQSTGKTDTVTPPQAPSQGADPLPAWIAPGGIISVSLGGIILIVREVNAGKRINVDYYKGRAEKAESDGVLESNKLSGQITRLEAKLDAAIKDTEAKHDLYVAEITHRRRLELIMAEHGIQLPAE